MWVASKNCTYCHSSSNQFDPNESVTFSETNKYLILRYGKGNAEGYISNDVVCIGDNLNLSVASQTFVLVVKDQDFGTMQADGVLGLGFKRLSDGHYTLMDSLKEQKIIENQVFAIYLSDNDFGALVPRPKSNIIIGGYDLETYAVSSQFTSVKVFAETGYWAVPLNSVKVGSEEINLVSVVGILDTGTSLIQAPGAELLEVMVAISRKGDCYSSYGFLVCDCGVHYQISDYPQITLVLDGSPFTLEPQQYFWRYNNFCQLLMVSIGKGNFWLLGDVFLRKYYAIFDMEQKKVGLVPSINNQISEPNESWKVILGFIGGVGAAILVLVLIFLIHKCRRNI